MSLLPKRKRRPGQFSRVLASSFLEIVRIDLRHPNLLIRYTDFMLYYVDESPDELPPSSNRRPRSMTRCTFANTC